MSEKKENQENKEQEVNQIKVSPVKESMNIDVIAAENPDAYAMKLTPNGRIMIIDYLNTRPMSEVEPFFMSMFDIEDKDPFFNVPWIKRLFDYLRNVCPRGESKPVVMGLAESLLLFKKEPKVVGEEGKTGEEGKEPAEQKPNMEVVDKEEK